MRSMNAMLAAATLLSLSSGPTAISTNEPVDLRPRPRGGIPDGPVVLRGGGGMYSVTLSRHSPGTQQRRRRRDQRRRRGRR